MDAEAHQREAARRAARDRAVLIPTLERRAAADEPLLAPTDRESFESAAAAHRAFNEARFARRRAAGAAE